jgi:hypothetical protein
MMQSETIAEVTRSLPGRRRVLAALNALVALALILFVVGAAWEFSTRRYLRGFAEAVVPLGAPHEQQVEAILAWMAAGPAREKVERATYDIRDPVAILRGKPYLDECGTATNAFINVAAGAGIEARRLLLIGDHGEAMHVAAEVNLDGRWVVVDPLFRSILRDSEGRPVTRQDLLDQAVFRQATSEVPGYDPRYTYKRTVHVRIEKIPALGGALRGALDRVAPRWELWGNWNFILDRTSALFATTAFALLVVLLLARMLVVRRLRDRGAAPPA